MKIALISDIHANLPALNAVLKDIEKNQVDKIYSLGDLVGKGPNPEETINLIKQKCTGGILGNWDDFLLSSPIQEMPINWYRKNLSQNSINYLKSLPYQLNFTLEGFKIVAFHAHPENVYKRTHQKFATTYKLELFQKGEDNIIPDIVIYADIHYNFIEQLNKNRILANTGSVGNPLDSPKAKYIILEGEPGPYIPKEKIKLKTLDQNHYYVDNLKGNKLKISLQEVEYDTVKAIQDAENSNMPEKEYYKREIQTGEYRYMYKWK